MKLASIAEVPPILFKSAPFFVNSAKLAKEKADTEYDRVKERTKNELSPVEIHFLESFEREQKRLLGGENN